VLDLHAAGMTKRVERLCWLRLGCGSSLLLQHPILSPIGGAGKQELAVGAEVDAKHGPCVAAQRDAAAVAGAIVSVSAAIAAAAVGQRATGLRHALQVVQPHRRVRKAA